MFSKRIKYFQFLAAAVCFVFSTISAAEDMSCEGFLLPASVPSVEHQEIIKQALQDAELLKSLNISDEPAAVSLQPKGMSHLQWFAGPGLNSSTQVLTSATLPAEELTSLANEAFHRTTESTPHHLSLSSTFVEPVGRPRIRTGIAAMEASDDEKPKELLGIFSVVMLDANEPGTLENLKINLVFYKHLHNLLNYTKTQEPSPNP